MHEFFCASAVLDKAEDAQVQAAALLRQAFGTALNEPYPPTLATTATDTVPSAP